MIEIVPSGRIDWCGECKKEHGYDCPKDGIALNSPVHPRKPFFVRLWNYIKSIFIRPKFSLNAIETITRDDILKRMSIASEAQEKLKIDSLYLKGMDFGIDVPEEVFEFYKDHPCDNNACPLCQPEEGKNWELEHMKDAGFKYTKEPPDKLKL